METHKEEEVRPQTRKEQNIEVIKEWNSDNLKGAKRLTDESFSDYKVRRRQENLWYKLYKTPGAHLVWLSKTLQQDKVNDIQFWSPGNTYNKDKHGKLER